MKVDHDLLRRQLGDALVRIDAHGNMVCSPIGLARVIERFRGALVKTDEDLEGLLRVFSALIATEDGMSEECYEKMRAFSDTLGEVMTDAHNAAAIGKHP